MTAKRLTFSEKALSALKALAENWSDLRRVVVVIKIPRDGGEPVVGFIPNSFTGDVSPLSDVAGLKVYVDEPAFCCAALSGKYIDVANWTFLAKPLPPTDGVSLVTMDIAED